jgi:hypothetical protein
VVADRQNGFMAYDSNTSPAAAFRLLRYAATALAAARVGLGLVALAQPSLVARPWVGPAGDELGGQVLGRALGARDMALGLGALAALSESSGGTRPAGTWFAAGALSDTVDAAVTAATWSKLPRRTRWLVAAAAAGAAAVGAAGACASLMESQGMAVRS